jgi:proteasome lid subunit RPN8/RPN11
VRVSRALPCPNVAAPEERTHRFVIDPRAVLNVRRSLRNTKETIVGFYHSHPDVAAEPSRTDMEYIRLWPETVWLIVPVDAGSAGEPRAWWLDEVDDPAARELRVHVPPVRATAAACE